jgi:hypothetical protein
MAWVKAGWVRLIARAARVTLPCRTVAANAAKCRMLSAGSGGSSIHA